jgi:1-acyl-sn-glycerol-3-phosphate acyltransferase
MFNTWWLMLRSAVFGAFLVLWSGFFGLAVLVLSLFDRRTLRTYGVQVAYARGVMWVAGVDLRVSGLQRLPSGPAVLMANHRSQLDPAALIAALPGRQLRWIAKKELGRLPLFGWGLRAAGHILVDRRNSPRAIASLIGARGVLERGFAVVFFPEGTRSMQPGMLPFKKGGFHLALQAGFPVVPVAVRGSGAVLPKRSHIVRPGTIEVEVLDPVATAGRSGADVHDLMALVRSRLESALLPPQGSAPGAAGR